MSAESLGMIEVRGYLGAVVAADAALKAADVELQSVQIISGGLVTVLLRGDVSAVNASVDAGVASIGELDCLVSQRVIPRLDMQVNGLTSPKKKVASYPKATEKVEVKSGEPSKKLDSNWATSKEQLEKMKVTELRHQAYQMNLATMSKAQIKMSNKERLITAILSDIERRNR